MTHQSYSYSYSAHADTDTDTHAQTQAHDHTAIAVRNFAKIDRRTPENEKDKSHQIALLRGEERNHTG